MTHRGLQVRMVLAGTILFGFYALVGALAAPVVGIPVVLAGSVLFVGVQYKLGKWLALRSVGAEDIDAAEYPELVDRFETLSDDMDVETPAFKRGRMGTPNAFAVGRKGSGVVVVSEVMLALYEDGHMSLAEMEGVLAHELAHVKNRDVVVLLLGQSIASIVGLSVFFLVELVTDDIPILGFIVSYVLSIVAQMLVMVFVLAISRYREYVADADAAEYTGNPDALARALATIKQVGESDQAADVDASTAAMCIFGGKRGLLDRVFATHPPMEKRIERLQSR